MRGFIRDVPWKSRLGAKQLGFVAVVGLTLALGLGMNTSMFSTADVVSVHRLPYPEADRLVQLRQRVPGMGYSHLWLSEAEYVDLREQQKSFEHFSVYRTGSANLIQDEKEVRINVAAVSEAFFSIPAISALVGRTFLPQEHAEANSDVVVLAYHTWQEDFAGVPEVVGKTVALDGRDLTIVGVMPPGFGFPYGWLDAWIPLAVDNANAESRETHNLLAVARLKPGITVETASSEVGTIALRLQQEHPNAYYFPSFGACVVRLK